VCETELGYLQSVEGLEALGQCCSAADDEPGVADLPGCQVCVCGVDCVWVAAHRLRARDRSEDTAGLVGVEQDCGRNSSP
jgi:hypothetical protein